MRSLKIIFGSKSKEYEHHISKESAPIQSKALSEKNKQAETYSSEEMIQIASDWMDYFLQTAPQLDSGTYKKDEIYMFCCWVLLDYGANYGYLSRDSNRDSFYSTIFQAVRNTGTYNQSDMEQFMFRIGQYKWQIAEMLKCDYPRTKIFFPRTLYARFVEIDFEHYTPPLDWEIDDSLIQFSEFLGTFWNKINSEIMEKYPDKKVN